MPRRKLVIPAAVLLTALSFPAIAREGNGGGGARGRPSAAKSALDRTPADRNAGGRVDVKQFPAVGGRPLREWLRFHANHVGRTGACSIWIDDPALPVDDPLTPIDESLFPNLLYRVGALRGGDHDGSWTWRFDTHKGGRLPFGATLAELAGQTVEIRDAGGTAVLRGTVPTIQRRR